MSLEIFAEKAATGCIFFISSRLLPRMGGCMSLLMIICLRLYFSPSLLRRFPDYCWLENEGPAKIAELCHMRLSAEKMSDDFFVAKGAHHIEVASKYYTYSGESNKKLPLSASFHAPPDPIEPYSMHAAPNICCYLIGQRRGPVVGLKMFWFSMNILRYMAFVRGGKKGIWLWVSSAYRYPGSHFKCALIGDCGYYLWPAIWKGMSNRPDSILKLT